MLAPQRPPAPPTEYFQLNLGGYDPETLLKVSDYPPKLPGYVGCMRGFQIGETLLDLPSKIKKDDSGKEEELERESESGFSGFVNWVMSQFCA